MGGYRNLNPDTIGALQARDKKGVGNQYVEEGKVVLVHRGWNDSRCDAAGDGNLQDIELYERHDEDY